ncbi:MAG: hypothetical protein Q8J78_15200 [Moraxellaceae bacterium]|nr:hypothetical protein [Moraxellaceae bacterium]
MDPQFIEASLINLCLSLAYTVIALFVAIGAILFIDKQLMKGIDIQQELARGNMAVAVFASTILIFIAVIVGVGFRG